MTSRDGYDAYTLYLGIKLHFHSDSYDFVKYNGKVKSDINSFLKRKDKYHFGKLFKTYKQDLQDFYVANLSYKDFWAGYLLDWECEKRYIEWKKRNQKLSYMFKTEVSDLLRKKHIKKVLEIKNGQHPILLKKYLAKEISLETLCIMDDIINMCDQEWKPLISEQLVYPEVHRLVKKYKTFLTYDYAKFRETLIELC